MPWLTGLLEFTPIDFLYLWSHLSTVLVKYRIIQSDSIAVLTGTQGKQQLRIWKMVFNFFRK